MALDILTTAGLEGVELDDDLRTILLKIIFHDACTVQKYGGSDQLLKRKLERLLNDFVSICSATMGTYLIYYLEF